MTPDISEFSYGFALTQELIKIADPLRAAPIFPSLIEEGRAGGGYDVNLDIPGFPLFIQFKRSDCMKRRSAREAAPPFNLNPPFYRMKITERSRSAQHEMLLDLDDGTNEVFYAAPLFHTVEELNAAYGSVTVSENCFTFEIQRSEGWTTNPIMSHSIACVFGSAQSLAKLRGYQVGNCRKFFGIGWLPMIVRCGEAACLTRSPWWSILSRIANSAQRSGTHRRQSGITTLGRSNGSPTFHYGISTRSFSSSSAEKTAANGHDGS